jgi:hypothetical protein
MDAAQNHIEPRWPVLLAIGGVTLLIAQMPDRVRFFPSWFPLLAGLVVCGPMIAVWASGSPRWLFLERMITWSFVVVIVLGNVMGMANLYRAIVGHRGTVDGVRLLYSAIVLWLSTVLVFSLLYWLLDRGGPGARANHVKRRPDWQFPEPGAGEAVPPGWQPGFVDYLFLGYETATAFSTTETLPLTPRAKLLMMVESAISLATIVLIGARAINTLGG